MSAALLQILQWFDDDGNPLAGGKVLSFEPETSTPKALYTDYTGTVAHPNPVILDAAGRAQIWTVGAYKLRITDANDTLIMPEIDNLDLGGTLLGSTEGSTTIVLNASDFVGQPRLIASGLFPIDVEPRYVLGEVLTSFGTSNGLTVLQIGDLSEGEDIWCTSLGITAGTKSTVGQTHTRMPRLINTAARDVIVASKSGTFDAAGSIRLTAFFATAAI